MKRTFGFAVILLGMALCAGATANAMAFHTPGKVPEIDPGMAIGGLAFLAGSLTLLRARRKK